MYISIDLHGVITKNPDFYCQLVVSMIKNGNKVYLLTGSTIYNAKCELEKLGLRCNIFTGILSIPQFLEDTGVPVIYENGNPIADVLDWDTAKSKICNIYEIDIHIDDSDVYGQYFTSKTQYIRVGE
jgi:hypothetical protein